MCDIIDKLACHFNNVIVTGDFNFPSIRWFNTHTAYESPDERILRRLVFEYNLSQIVKHQQRDTVILDLVFLTESLSSSDVEL